MYLFDSEDLWFQARYLRDKAYRHIRGYPHDENPMQLGPFCPSQSKRIGTLDFLLSQFRSLQISPVGLIIDGTTLQKQGFGR